jgi:redox-sensing transcriptional repressor
VKSSNKGSAKGSAPRPSADQVSELTTNRLSVYLRCLTLLEDAGVRTISSQALAEQFHLNAAQIRKDLAYFGEFGVRGVGYYVRDLRRHLRAILGLDRKLRVAIMGAGNLGLALADYPGFRQEGFEISALFDTLSTKVGQQSRGGVTIYDIHDLKKIARRDGISIAVIAVPAPSAQHVVDQVVASGIKAVLNFSPGTLRVPADVKLKSVDLTVSLESLSFFLAQGEVADKP